MAVCDKHHEKVKLLLEAGADPNTVAGSIARVTPIMNLIRRDPTASQGALPTIRMLVEGGADVNFYSTFGTALHVAAKVEKEPLYVNELLALGANPNTPGEETSPVRDFARTCQTCLLGWHFPGKLLLRLNKVFYK